METLPTSGLPPLMRNWSEYTWLLNHMVETGFIKTIREIWWDVRPAPQLRDGRGPDLRHAPHAPPRPRADGPGPVPGARPFRGDRPRHLPVQLPPVHGPPEQVAGLPLRDGRPARRPAPFKRSRPASSSTACSTASRPRTRARLPRPPRDRPRDDRRADGLGHPDRATARPATSARSCGGCCTAEPSRRRSRLRLDSAHALPIPASMLRPSPFLH